MSASLPPTMSLPLVTLPHIITSSLALSLLPDLLPRLSHSNANIRKKTVAALYRLALVYPDTLRTAWPKIKDMLMDENEDSSVTAAVVNVVCELGSRRPRDFLAFAPRLFGLLVDGGNNWMAIKIIKLVRAAILLSFLFLHTLVCNLDAIGTALGQKATTLSDQSHSIYTCHVTTLRVHQRCDTGGYFGRYG